MGAFTYPGTNTTGFDLGLGRRKKGLDVSAENYVLGTLSPTKLFSVASIGAGVANTAIQDYFPLPGRCKIPKISVYFATVDALTGHSFNIVLGTGTYTASATSVPGNDNAGVPPVAYSAAGVPTGDVSPTYPAGGGGIASNPAVAGNTFFDQDVVFNATNFPTIVTTTGVGLTYAQLLIPDNPDAVWPNGGILTLRAVTPASTGAITYLIICAYIEPQPLAPSYPDTFSLENNIDIPAPGIQF